MTTDEINNTINDNKYNTEVKEKTIVLGLDLCHGDDCYVDYDGNLVIR